MTSVFLLDYPLRILPGLTVLAAAFLVLGRCAPLLRIVVVLLGFVLLRDAMTPLGLWSLGTTPNGVVWLRLAPDPIVLIGFGASGVLLALAVAFGRGTCGGWSCGAGSGRGRCCMRSVRPRWCWSRSSCCCGRCRWTSAGVRWR